MMPDPEVLRVSGPGATNMLQEQASREELLTSYTSILIFSSVWLIISSCHAVLHQKLQSGWKHTQKICAAC